MTTQTCYECKHLGSQPATDTWLRIGDVDYWCDNDDVIEVPETLDEDFMEGYPEKCKKFEAIAKAEQKNGEIAL
jgi:hypothetical protein